LFDGAEKQQNSKKTIALINAFQAIYIYIKGSTLWRKSSLNNKYDILRRFINKLFANPHTPGVSNIRNDDLENILIFTNTTNSIKRRIDVTYIVNIWDFCPILNVRICKSQSTLLSRKSNGNKQVKKIEAVKITQNPSNNHSNQ